MQSILNLTKAEIEQWCVNNGYPKYRGGQIFLDLYQKRKTDFADMSTLPKELKEKLAEEFEILQIASHDYQISEDTTEKLLINFKSGKAVECVLIPNNNEDSRTLCISTQEGCKLNCKFCATGKLGFISNLSVSEIISQYLFAEQVSNWKISNIVLMGMGDPMDNFENVIKFLSRITKETELLGKNRITLSTAGFTENIIRLADSGLNIKIAFSLHSPIQSNRESIMPAGKRWKIKDIMSALEYYYQKTRQDITFEYIVFDDFNNSDEDIVALQKLTRRFPCKVNLIQYHNIEFTGFKSDLVPASYDKILKFQNKLKSAGVNAFIRKSAGEDIAAACGQLAYGKKK